MSKHGGSPFSGLVHPAGLKNLELIPGTNIAKPPEVIAAEKQAAQRQERALQLERRRLGLEVLKQMVSFGSKNETVTDDTSLALKYADELIKQTGGGI